MRYFLFLFLLASPPALGGSGVIAVKDGEGKLCVSGGPEWVVMRLTSEEAAGALKNWLHHRPQHLVLEGRHLVTKVNWDENDRRKFIEIAFTGNIKFCGNKERENYFQTLIDEMAQPLKDNRVFVLVLFHAKSDSLLSAIDKAMASSPKPEHLANLEKAKRLLLYQRKTPTPYPTESAVKKILKASP